MAYYKIIACQIFEKELAFFSSRSEHAFDVQYLEQELHNTPEKLRDELQDAIDAVEGDYDAILLAYGLCSNGVEGLVAKKHPLVIVKGHDCITFFLGSKERYKEYFDEHPGTYWYTPGWIDTGSQPGKGRYEKLLESYVEKYGEDNAKFLMEMEQGWFNEYSNAAYTDLGTEDSEKHKAYTKSCAEWLNWNYDELDGDDSLVKAFLEGNWDEDRFLVVEVGQKIAASHDDQVLKAISCG